MISYIKKVKFLINLFFLSKNEKIFIKKNELRFSETKNINKKNIILLDLFDWYPWIHFWSFLANELSQKKKCEIHFFYFRLYEGFFSKFRIYIHKLKKIYRSFGVTKGISEYDLDKKNTNIEYIKDRFDKIKTKKLLYNYKYKNTRIGDLIYSQYLRAHLKPTLNVNDKKLKDLFIRAHLIYDAIDVYFKRYNVKYIIPSHMCYVSYGLVSRIGSQKYGVSIIKIFSKNRGKNLFRLIKIDKYLLDENPFYKFKKIFSNLPNHKKRKWRKIGKSIMLQRLTYKYDPNIPYMKKNQFNKINMKNINLTKKKNVFLFAHCYFDNPMRYRNMIFTDFYEQVNFLLSKSNKNSQYQWYYKPHPNELGDNINYINLLKKKFPKVIFLDKEFSHNSVLKLNPHLIITNFGTVAHEFAYFKIPVINTGDNPHVNYNFSLNPKNKRELSKMIFNISEFSSKINFDKKNIYEFLFLQYHFFANEYNSKKLINDKKLSKNRNEDNSDLIIKNINKNYKFNEKNLTLYTKLFLEKNL
jgi:hypothetical protein